jgi:hypothetical protein
MVIFTFIIACMKTKQSLEKYHTFFESYYDSFRGLNAEQRRNFEIKKGHSYRVASLMQEMAVEQCLPENIKSVSYCTGLFHDMGWFPLYIRHSTYKASAEDHAALSIVELQKNRWRELVDPSLVETVERAIFYHNKYDIPGNLSREVTCLAYLLRDADKLDILEVLCNYYERRDANPNHTLTWGLPEGHKVSDEVAEYLRQQKIVPKTAVKNKHDIKALQMSWVYDIHFRVAFQKLAQKRFIERIYQFLPKSETVIEFYRNIKITIENRISS